MIKVGDLITAYHAGYHIVTKIERRFYTEEDVKYGSYKSHKVGTEYNPLITKRLQILLGNIKNIKRGVVTLRFVT